MYIPIAASDPSYAKNMRAPWGQKRPLPLPCSAYTNISIVLHETSSYWNGRTFMWGNISSVCGEQNFPLFLENHWRYSFLKGISLSVPDACFTTDSCIMLRVSILLFRVILEGCQNFGKPVIVSIRRFYSSYHNDTNRHNRTPILL